MLEERFPNLAAWRDRVTRRARLGRSVRSPSGRAHRPALVMAADRAMSTSPRLAVLRAAPSRASRAELDAWAATPSATRTATTAPTSTPSAARSSARSARPAGSRHAVAGTRVRRRRRRDRHALDLPRARDARAPRRPGRLRVRDAGPRLGRDQPRRQRRAEGALPAAGRARRGDRRVRAVRARRRLRRRARWRCAARADGDDYVLDGEKTWISNGGIADFYVVFARTGDAGDPAAKGARGISRLHRRRRHAGLRDRRAHRRDRAASAGAPALRRLPRAGGAAHRRRGRGLQGRDAHARRLPHLGRRRRARLRAPRLRRGAARARPRARCSAASSPTSS